ncbi:ParB N-terminal domain-containing protein [Brevundimonas sp.]|uniref:ParB/RepB/Spo0J family partition protein n=1 Tax=Brevundimonas sp. TaxID=1871086 RepID=UPI0025BEEB38|nr:ParB N-terminal domain-containing protein [Brevundimonas sp.]MCG2662892.1 ParB N-terminal domain-containing protein [Brevundimonas sp.]
MTELNILAVQNAALLTAIAETPDATKAQLATKAGKDRSNLNRSLAALIGDGLIQEFSDTHRCLTRAGEVQLHAIRRAEGRADDTAPTAEALPEGLLALRHDQILPDPDNARQDWTSDEAKDELDALRADIVQNGLLQNLVVRPMADDDLQDPTITVTTPAGELTLPRYRLVAGERRWRAIGEAISDGDWEPETPILARFLDRDAKETRFAAIAENLLRRKLNPIEKAKGFEQLSELGFENKLIADRLGYTPQHVQQHRRFLKLDEADQARMTLPRDDPKHLSVRDARQKLAHQEATRPLDLPADERLLFAEMAHRIRSRGGYSFGDFEVSAAGIDDPVLAKLIAGQFSGPINRKNYGELLGRFSVSLSWYGHPERYFTWFDKATAKALAAGLADEHERAGAQPADGATYVTPWLNGPFEIDAEGQAMVDQAAARDAAHADARARQEAEESALHARVADVRRKHLELLNAAAKSPPAQVSDGTVEAAAAINRDLPWSLRHDGMILSAKGTEVRKFGHWGQPSDEEMVLAQIIVVAVNSAAGLATPPIISREAAARLTEPAYIEAMADRLSDFLAGELDDEELSARASKILSDHLGELGIAYGEDGSDYDWTEDGAEALINALHDTKEEAAAEDQDEAA